ncbi:MAG TPA: hypothetical protein VI998_02480 [Patescibacteria group bacterium]|nr:hypothetical protein [Patescibacteria group bacterium]
MFNQPTPPQPLQNQPSQSESLPDVPVYAMPEKFTSPQSNMPQQSGGGGGKKLFIIVIAVVVLLLIGGGAYAFLNYDKLFGPKTPANNNVSLVNDSSVGNLNNANANKNIDNSNANANANANTNGNINSGGFGNLNQNSNSAGNSNSANSNANANVNSSLNSNGNTNAANSNINATSPLTPSKDTDEDGLTDSEEAVYQTNVNMKDTDGDNYYDGAEVAAGFDPAKGSGAKLADSAAMKAYSNSSAGYSAFYPAGWAAGAAGEGGSDVMFTSTTGEFIQISVQENVNRMPVLDWYLTQSPSIDQTKVNTAVINGKSAVLSPDNLNVYIGDGSRIIIATYNPGTKTQISFGKTFQYIYQHLTITAPTQTNANANSANSNSANANSANINSANTNAVNANTASSNANNNTNALNTNNNQ